MLSEKMNIELNDQINAELYSAYLYLQMASFFTINNFDGFANWMEVQVQEEMAHAKIFYNHILERGGKVNLLTIEQPPYDWNSALQIFEAAYKHEQYVTSRIHKLMILAKDENDFPSISMLNWFVDEQVEEESNTERLSNQLRLIGDSGQGLLMLDRELAARVFVMPAPLVKGA